MNDARFDVARLLSLSLGLRHLAELDSATAFTLAQATGGLAGGWQNSIFVTSGISWQWQKTGGPIDSDSPLEASVDLQNATRLPVLYSPVPESDFTLQLSVNIPSPIAHQVIILGVKSVDVLGGPFSSFTDSFAVPRGFPGPSVRTVPGQAVASIDYAIPIGLFDQPLAFSIAATGARIAVHAEGVSQWGTGFQAFAVEPFVYVGGDMSFQMAFNAIPFGVMLGVASRINTAAPSSFDPAADIGIYFSIGTIGLAGGIATGVTPKSPGQVVPRS